MKHEKKSAFAYERRRHVFERCYARHTIECTPNCSPLHILLERDADVILQATHSRQLLLPADASI